VEAASFRKTPAQTETERAMPIGKVIATYG
jgi:hypothetical protein